MNALLIHISKPAVNGERVFPNCTDICSFHLQRICTYLKTWGYLGFLFACDHVCARVCVCSKLLQVTLLHSAVKVVMKNSDNEKVKSTFQLGCLCLRRKLPSKLRTNEPFEFF